MRLSLVIPAYNAEAFLRRCLASCLTQDLPADAYEIIVVDDGSTDGTRAVADGVASSSPVSVRVVSRPNGGLSAARNMGMDLARGEYVWFVDADDWVEENCLQALLGEADGCDILAFGATDRLPAPDGGFLEAGVFRYPASVLRSGPEHIAAMSEKLKMCAPFHFFRRAFLAEAGLRFPEGLLHEDAEFTPRAVYRARTVRVSTAVPYDRLVRPGSISRTPDPRRITDLLAVVSRLRAFLEEEPVADTFHAPFCSIIANVANQAMKLVRDFPDADASPVVAADGLPAVFLGAAERKYRLEGRLLKWFPHHPVAVYAALAWIRDRLSGLKK